MLSEDQIKLLQGYRDKTYITSILCQQSEEHFSFLKSMVNIHGPIRRACALTYPYLIEQTVHEHPSPPRRRQFTR